MDHASRGSERFMPTTLRRLPFFPDATSLRIPGGPATSIQHDRIVICASLAPVNQATWAGSNRKFPVLLDLGFNGSLLLREDHLDLWVNDRLEEGNFPFLRVMSVDGEHAPAIEAALWLHPNLPGFRDQFLDTPPFRIELPGGMIVCPASMSRFQLPLLGVSALRKNRLRLLVNGEKRYISLRAPQRQV
jgi:hypothetical protein